MSAVDICMFGSRMHVFAVGNFDKTQLYCEATFVSKQLAHTMLQVKNIHRERNAIVNPLFRKNKKDTPSVEQATVKFVFQIRGCQFESRLSLGNTIRIKIILVVCCVPSPSV